jgi:hypothetical protein
MKKFPTHMLLNGVMRRVITDSFQEYFNPNRASYYRFFLDTNELPGRPCSEHSLTGISLSHIAKGYTVTTSGNVYGGKP